MFLLSAGQEHLSHFVVLGNQHMQLQPMDIGLQTEVSDLDSSKSFTKNEGGIVKPDLEKGDVGAHCP